MRHFPNRDATAHEISLAKAGSQSRLADPSIDSLLTAFTKLTPSQIDIQNLDHRFSFLPSSFHTKERRNSLLNNALK